MMKNKKILVILIFISFLFLFTFLSVQFISRAGKDKVIIEYAPSNSQLSIDGSEVSGNTHYLKPGTYKIKVSLDNFKDREVELDTTKRKELALILEPANQKGQAIAKNDPNYAKEAEALASKSYAQESQQQYSLYTFKSKLPIDMGARYKVGYGVISEDNKNTNPYAMALYVESDSPYSRYLAIKSIASELGINPAEIEIIFNDLENPFN